MLNINNIKNNLREVGYIASDELAKTVALFEVAGKRPSRNIPAMLLEGPAGAGKTALAEAFAKVVGAKLLFLQCFPGMGSDSFIAEPNVAAIISRDSQNSIKDGILVRSLKETTDGPTVVVLDELDKASPEVDSFLLDYLNSGRVSNGKDIWTKGDGNIWVFITSNKQRSLSDALVNRCRKVNIPRPSKELFLDILGIDDTNDEVRKGWEMIYDEFPNFSIRQGKSYIEDLRALGIERHDPDVLSQYISEEDMRHYNDNNDCYDTNAVDVDLSQYEVGVVSQFCSSDEYYSALIGYISIKSNSGISITTKDNWHDASNDCATNCAQVYFRINDFEVLLDLAMNNSELVKEFISSYQYHEGMKLKMKNNEFIVNTYFENGKIGVIEYYNPELNIRHLFVAEKDSDDGYIIFTNNDDFISLFTEEGGEYYDD